MNTSLDKYPTITFETIVADTEKTSADNDDDSNISPVFANNKMDYLSPNFNSEERQGKDHRMYRSTSLKTTASTKSPNEKKIVRFADALGLDLTDVRHFSKECLPNISKSAFADLKISQNNSPITSRKRKTSKSTSGCRTLVPKFHQPGADPLFFNRIKDEKVCLENIEINGTNIKGIIMVSNLGFEKMVLVRYTTDNWTSNCDIIADFISSQSTDKSFDRFNFKIELPCIKVRGKLILVVKYVVNGQEFWDNNHGNDYILECRNVKS